MESNALLISIGLIISIINIVNGYVHMCWYVNWSELRPKLPFDPDFIDYNLCSHILYSAAVIDPEKYDVVFLQNNIKGNMNKILSSKKDHKHLKVILVIGSYDTESFGFEAVTNPNNTEAMNLFSLKLIKFLRKYEFDGVLLDYEFPNMRSRGSEPHTKHGFSLLLKTLKEHFRQDYLISKKPQLLLLAALAARLDWIDNFYETDQVVKYLDYLMLLSYDLRSSKEKKTRISSALFPLSTEIGFDSTLNQASAVAKWITEGAKPGKIVLGIAAYGRSFELADVNKVDPGSPINGSAPPGLITDERGVLSYFEICEKLSAEGSIKKWQGDNLAPYLVYDRKYWVGYEDVDSITEKMLFIKANKLAGAFMWSIDLDDFRGDFCSQGAYPLLSAMKTELEQSEATNEYSTSRSVSLMKNQSSYSILVGTYMLYYSVFSFFKLYMF